MQEFAVRMLRAKRGATAIEYGLLAALISLAFVAAFAALGLDLANIFQTASDALAGRRN